MGVGEDHDLANLARSLARGDVSTSEAVANQLARLREVHERTNCVAFWNPRAIEEAAELDETFTRAGAVGPLHGVPMTVKDWIDVAGMPCTGGMTESRTRVPERDATTVARLRAAGAVIVAKTAVQPESELFGLVHNPHDRARSPGGSSSGEAAAVGGGGSIVGLGSDSGGSIRLPAAWCGAAGLKPSAGLVPVAGHFPRVGERGDGRTQIGPLASSVAGLSAVLSVIAGSDDRDAGVAPVAIRRPDDVDIRGLRVGWSCGESDWVVAGVVRAAVERAVTILETAGARASIEVSMELDNALDITRRYWRRRELTGAEADDQLIDWDRYRTRMLRALTEVDVVVMPAVLTVAPLHRALEGTDFIFTLPASLTGAPAVVLPIGDDAGLPIAVQVVAHRWRDDVALRVASVLEEETRLDSRLALS